MLCSQRNQTQLPHLEAPRNTRVRDRLSLRQSHLQVLLSLQQERNLTQAPILLRRCQHPHLLLR
jgi:hypothetical protein